MTTRKSAETHIREHLGPAAEFTPDEFPTLRSVLRYGLHLHQKQLVANDANRCKYPTKEMASDIIGPLIAQWQRGILVHTTCYSAEIHVSEESTDSLVDYLGHSAPARIEPDHNRHVC